jgi:hypothetical protein
VAAGILRTSVVQNVLGSSPVLIVILPVTLAGALLLKRAEGGVWVSAASMALALTALIQTLFLGFAAYYIEKIIQEHREELMTMPGDEDVKRFDDIANERARARKYVSEWRRLPCWLKLTLGIGILAETASAYLFQLFGSRCFENFDITDSIERNLDGNVLNIVKPLGWIGIGLFATGCVALIILGRWISLQIFLGAKVPADEEARQRRMSEVGLDPDSEDDEDDAAASNAVSPMTSADDAKPE